MAKMAKTIFDNIVKPLAFPVVMYGCESWTIKKAKELMLLNYSAVADS